MGRAFTYGGVWLGDPAYGLTVLGGPGQALADVKLDVHELGGADGATTSGRFLKPRFWTFECLCIGASAADLRAKMDSIKRVLNSASGNRWLVPDWETQVAPEQRRMRSCRLNGPINDHIKGGGAHRFQLNFVAEDPADYGVDEVVQVLAVESDPASFTVPATGVVAGTLHAEPVWEIENTGGAVTELTLANETTGESLTWTGALGAGDVLRIDSRARVQHVTKLADGETAWANAIRWMQWQDLFPRLAPGVANTIQVTGLAAGTVTATYRSRWL